MIPHLRDRDSQEIAVLARDKIDAAKLSIHAVKRCSTWFPPCCLLRQNKQAPPTKQLILLALLSGLTRTLPSRRVTREQLAR